VTDEKQTPAIDYCGTRVKEATLPVGQDRGYHDLVCSK
jgi:hypothetical protein